MEQRKFLVRNISHELKTPIGVIKGYAEGLQFGVVEDKEKTEKYCQVIAAECDRMDEMVRELLNLSMLESGTFTMNATCFAADKIVQSVVERFAPLMDEKEIICNALISESELCINADYDLIERAVSNFLTNALNHIDDNKVIEVGAQSVENYIRISIYNSGAHISQQDLTSIWDIFYKTDQARTRQYGGHGLGLSIVRLIAQLHGGKYGVENVQDGVLFYIEIPKQ
ncbi:MAG: hypothetical protein CVU87_12280 [Firmicutes bacterium HGW-Firmicutes-12]|nr:MAG: hypothetical protein CVU87_12280 [Firmicutes bacterium HGW-Firmicutes-12]